MPDQMKTDFSLKDAYKFAGEHGVLKAQMEQLHKARRKEFTHNGRISSANTRLKRAYVVVMFEKHGIFDAFKKKFWPYGDQDKGKHRGNLLEIKESYEKQHDPLIAGLSDAAAPFANDSSEGPPERTERTTHPYIRDTPMARKVKELYDFQCQICGVRLEIAPGEFYAEAHHLQPLGGNHNGLDVKDDLLCLCPNHHVLFDHFAIPFDPAKLRFKNHDLRKSFIDYHNERFRDRQGR